ncbi:MAG: hypothetical protein ACYTGN_05595 [Planctomycetota bacterium]|jgi:hypothetical protein
MKRCIATILLLSLVLAVPTLAEDPAPIPTLTVKSIEWTATPKVRGRRSVSAAVLVVDENGLPVSGATVWGSIVFPSGVSQGADEPQLTDDSGVAHYVVGTRKPSKGTYGLYVNDVTLDGYVFDMTGSVHYAEITVK